MIFALVETTGMLISRDKAAATGCGVTLKATPPDEPNKCPGKYFEGLRIRVSGPGQKIRARLKETASSSPAKSMIESIESGRHHRYTLLGM